MTQRAARPLLARFSRKPVAVRVPATCANLGPGFDSFGLALALHDSVEAAVTPGGLEVEVAGEGASAVPGGETHLVVRALRATLDVLGVPQPGLRLSCRNSVPQGRGLGSSAAAIVAGIRLAEALVLNSALAPGQDLELAATLEGHPDNVAACLLGGFTIAWTADFAPVGVARPDDAARRERAAGPVGAQEPSPSATFDTRARFLEREGANRPDEVRLGGEVQAVRLGGAVRAVRLDVLPGIQPVVLVPPVGLSTELARSVLPGEVSHAGAALTAGRAGLLVAALTTYPEHLLAATKDRLHQEFRRSTMPETLDLVERMREAGVAAVVSGAGPTVLALATEEHPAEPVRWTPVGWRCLVLSVDSGGAAGMPPRTRMFEQVHDSSPR